MKEGMESCSLRTEQPDTSSLRDGERIDEAGFGGIRVIQRRGFGYGVDSVLLSSFAAGETGGAGMGRIDDLSGSGIADLGTGCGIIAMITAHKLPGSHVTGIEMSPDAASRAVRGTILSGLEERVEIICSDILDIKGRHDYDAVLTNPPYFRREAGRSRHEDPGSKEPGARSDERYISRHETSAGLADFVRTAASMLKPGGSLFMVHRPDRLTDILTEMRDARIEPRELQFVVPFPGEMPNIVLVHGIYGAGPDLKVLPEIVVRGSDGIYTDMINSFYERQISGTQRPEDTP